MRGLPAYTYIYINKNIYFFLLANYGAVTRRRIQENRKQEKQENESQKDRKQKSKKNRKTKARKIEATHTYRENLIQKGNFRNMYIGN